MLKESGYSEERFMKDIHENLEDIRNFHQEKNMPEKDYHAVHIVFGDSTSGGLNYALKKIGKYENEKIISFSDTFSIGPLLKLNEEQGLYKRYEWLGNHFIYDDGEIDSDITRFKDAVLQIKSMPDHIPVTIWTGENAHEQTGMRLAIFLLRGMSNNLFCMNTSVLYKELFSKPELDYEPLYTGELIPEKISEMYAKNRGVLLTIEERQLFEEEWIKLSATHQVLRIWEDGKVKSMEDDYYDEYIINTVRNPHMQQKKVDFIKTARVIGEVIGHTQQYHGDLYFEYRIRHLIMNGTFEKQGVPNLMRFYSVKLFDIE